MKVKNIFYLILTLGLYLLPQKAGAVETEFGPVNNITDYISAIFVWLLPVVGGLGVIMMIYAGYLYLTSQGNPDSINRAKDIIIGVVTGFALLFLMKILLDQIGV